MTRGIRNNNPLNIRRTATSQWKGLSVVQSDSEFCQFQTLEWGWRAAFRLLTRTYYQKHRLNTIRAIVSRWAPPLDNNNTGAYIANVARLTHIMPDEPLGNPTEHPARWMLLGVAMAIQENGTTALDGFAMLRGWEESER